mgnify:CR=1 FL=1
MLINNFDPVAFQVFSFEIRWYSLSYLFGLIFGWIYCQKFLIKEDFKKKLFEDYLSYLIFGLIIGGRIGYVIFYNPSYYLNNPIEIIMIWNGGMSFHGGVIGVVLSTIIFCKKNNEEIFYFLDLVALSAPIGIFLGRISNFINSELYGRETDVFWSVKFISVDDLYRHPSQIYEALFEGIILFIILNILYKSLENRTGLISALFLILYSFFRFFIEYFREPDSHLGFIYFNLSLGQIACIITFIFGSILFYYLKNAERK